MNVYQSPECMASMMNASVDIPFLYGENFAICLIIYPFQQSLMKEFCACMVDCLLISMIFSKLMKYKGPRMYPTKEFFVICYGQILKILKDGVKMREEYPLFLDKILLRASWKSMTLIWYAELTRLLRRVMNFLPIEI